jgi:hypothetical protein
VLDACLQSGLSAIPKWEPWAWMGMYVGQSLSYASNLLLVLNPRTGHVLPQFHVVYDDDFIMVSYLWMVTVPPHWAELFKSLAAIPVYTEKQVGTWQSIPDIKTDNGDFSGQTKSTTTSDQVQEGVKHRVTFADELVQNDTEVNRNSAQDIW